MKYVTAFLLAVLCVIGLLALILLTRDKPQFADGEPTAVVKDWLSKQPESVLTVPAVVTAASAIDSVTGQDRGQAIWMEEYIGRGKWQVSKANLPASNNENMTFEEWIARTKGWNENRLAEYASDLSPEDQHTFQVQMRTYNPGQQDLAVIEKWYIYEKSRLVEEIMD